MQGTPSRGKKWLLLKLGLAAAVLVVAGFLLLRGVDLKGMVEPVMRQIRSVGPLVFFAAMAVLLAIGFPFTAFCLAAGSAFGEQLGIRGILAGAAATVLVNVTLTYWLARYALRPLLERWLGRLGYRIPVVEVADQIEVTILVRITPGPPFLVQSYLLGLAQIPFRKYILPSFILPMCNATGILLFGDALAQGKAKWAVVGISLLIAVGLGVHLLRRHYAKRKREPQSS
ncbi:MAG: VTT domain-containing protein [Opitutaceae bacterium]|nr:VTT domain-containing protein [Opitutaceae bacterium]